MLSQDAKLSRDKRSYHGMKKLSRDKILIG